MRGKDGKGARERKEGREIEKGWERDKEERIRYRGERMRESGKRLRARV